MADLRPKPGTEQHKLHSVIYIRGR